MTVNCKVTIWHFDESTGCYIRTVFDKAYADFKSKISKNRIKQRGFYNEDNAKVRIPTTKEIVASVGDYLYIGKSDSPIPDRSEAMKIVEISDNRKGGSPHYRLSCGG